MAGKSAQTFNRYRPAMVFFYIMAGGMSALFGLRVFIGGSPITPEIYGHLIYSVPAVTWIIAQASLTALASLAIIRGWRKIAGGLSVVLTMFFSMFTAMAISGGAEGTILVAGSLFHGAIPSFAIAMICFGWPQDE